MAAQISTKGGRSEQSRAGPDGAELGRAEQGVAGQGGALRGTGQRAGHLEILNTEQVEDHRVGEAELAFQLSGFACHHLAYITFIRYLPHTNTA